MSRNFDGAEKDVFLEGFVSYVPAMPSLQVRISLKPNLILEAKIFIFFFHCSISFSFSLFGLILAAPRSILSEVMTTISTSNNC